MSNCIITIGRQYGAGGREIAEKLAKQLQIPLYDRKLVAFISAHLEKGVSLDELDLTYDNLYGSVSPYETMFADLNVEDDNYLFTPQSKAIKALAEKNSGIFSDKTAAAQKSGLQMDTLSHTYPGLHVSAGTPSGMPHGTGSQNGDPRFPGRKEQLQVSVQFHGLPPFCFSSSSSFRSAFSVSIYSSRRFSVAARIPSNIQIRIWLSDMVSIETGACPERPAFENISAMLLTSSFIG